ncbi:MAG: hypothetical protein Q4F00_13865 [bacterium]|nr:hypothetical protein [bacterium]
MDGTKTTKAANQWHSMKLWLIGGRFYNAGARQLDYSEPGDGFCFNEKIGVASR